MYGGMTNQSELSTLGTTGLAIVGKMDIEQLTHRWAKTIAEGT